ncbi:GTP-binding protein Era-like protein [Actinidia rufa]|uniref:GTP-binding protein Era-like protein n=1 Tax=Actinidia rufa TaxID=165716 RepID=A0A7J0E3W9_9ERIC|nr:GTP-binding protein Era-like protein [Actinidia rufa]
MELGLHLRLHLHHLSARSIDNRHSPIHCCSHSNFNSGADNPLLRRRFTFHHTHFHYKATPTSGRPKYTYRYRNSLAEGEGEYEDEDGEEEEVTTSLDGDDEVDDDESSLSGFLSLSVKPDRNMALLDDYELEELDALPDPNHRSGSFSPPSLLFLFEFLCVNMLHFFIICFWVGDRGIASNSWK